MSGYIKNMVEVAYEMEKANKRKRLAKKMIEHDIYWGGHGKMAESCAEGEFNDSLYRILLSLLPKDIARTLKKLEKEILKREREIVRTTGWWFYDSNTIYDELRVYPPSIEVPTVLRNENGFYPKQYEYADFIDRMKERKSVRFYEENKDKLQKIHELLELKKAIITRVLSLVDDEYKELARQILIFFGVEPFEFDGQKRKFHNRHFR